MRVESSDLINLGQRHLHFRSERGQMRRREVPVLILDEMQMFDQKIATARPIGKQPADFYQRLWIDLPSFRGTGWPTSPVTPGSPAQGRLLNSAHL